MYDLRKASAPITENHSVGPVDTLVTCFAQAKASLPVDVGRNISSTYLFLRFSIDLLLCWHYSTENLGVSYCTSKMSLK